MTKPNNRERIRDLENQLAETLREVRRLRAQVKGRSPFQNVRIIDNGDVSKASSESTNLSMEFLDVDDHDTTPTTTPRSTLGAYNVWRIPGINFTKGDQPKVVFYYNGHWYEIPTPSPEDGLFPVDLIQTGGGDGNGTTAATWTYTVRREGETDDLELAVDPTAAPHNYNRPLGKRTAATKGTAHINESGALELDYINEQIVTKQCEA